MEHPSGSWLSRISEHPIFAFDDHVSASSSLVKLPPSPAQSSFSTVTQDPDASDILHDGDDASNPNVTSPCLCIVSGSQLLVARRNRLRWASLTEIKGESSSSAQYKVCE